MAHDDRSSPVATTAGATWESALLHRLRTMPLECYPIALLIGLAIIVLLKPSRRPGRRDTAQPAERSGLVQPRGTSVFGAFVATVGLAIIAVGATAVARAHFLNEAGFFRPGVIIAAVGQVLLLVGILALGLHGRGDSRSAIAGESGSLELELARLQLATAPRNPAHSGQIAQLKAQLACLAQQLDHLNPPTAPHAYEHFARAGATGSELK